jgi:hypothetical protein
MKHVTKASKKLSIKSKTLLKSSLKKGFSIYLADNPFEAKIKSDFDCFLETKMEFSLGIMMSYNAKA